MLCKRKLRSIMYRIRRSHLITIVLLFAIFIWYRSKTSTTQHPVHKEERVERTFTVHQMSVETMKGQAMVNYMGEQLGIEFAIVANLGSHFKAQLTLHNTADELFEPPHTWALYFYTQRRPYGGGSSEVQRSSEKMAWRDVKQGSIRIRHIQGSLFEITPTNSFGSLQPFERKTVDLMLQAYIVSRTDMYPNWYVAVPSDPSVSPRVLRATTSESLSYFAALTEIQQLKRRSSDKHLPWTPQQRFQRNTPQGDPKDPKGSVRSQVPPLVPTPKEYEVVEDGWIVLNERWSVCDTQEEFTTDVPNLLAKILHLEVVTKAPNHCVSFTMDETLAEEEYEILCERDTIRIRAATQKGAFYAVMSMQNLIDTSDRPVKLPMVRVRDAPRFLYRGLMLDVSRNFFPAAVIKRVLDVMALYKMNVLHMHLTDCEGWRLQIPGLPELTEIGSQRGHDLSEEHSILPQLGSGPHPSGLGSGFYTVEEYQDLLHYANTKHIEIIPEIDVPGHSHAAIKAMEARSRRLAPTHPHTAGDMLLSDPLDTSQYQSPQNFVDDAINPCIDSSYKFVEHVLDAIIKMHEDIQPLRVFHFGGDEVPPGAFLGSPKCQEFMKQHPKLKTTPALKQHFVRKVGELVASRGLNLQGWNDGFNGDSMIPMARSEFRNEEVRVNSWINAKQHSGPSNTYKMANDGYKVILSYSSHLYLDHPQEPDPEERGLYWSTRYADTRKIYSMISNNIYAAEEESGFGDRNVYHPDDPGQIPLTAPHNIIGIQAEVWTETIRTQDQLESMLLPRLVAVAERAWHAVPWERASDPWTPAPPIDPQGREVGWESFAARLGQYEVKRLTDMGYRVYLPPPGAIWSSESTVEVNTAFPGLPVEYSTDDGRTWTEATNNKFSAEGVSQPILLRTRSPSADQIDLYSRVVKLPAR